MAEQLANLNTMSTLIQGTATAQNINTQTPYTTTYYRQGNIVIFPLLCRTLASISAWNERQVYSGLPKPLAEVKLAVLSADSAKVAQGRLTTDGDFFIDALGTNFNATQFCCTAVYLTN